MHQQRLYSLGLTILYAFAILPAYASAQGESQTDWARWRGPDGNGIADGEQRVPVQWDADTNVVWKSKVPGRGHSSPIVVGNKIFLTTADEAEQSQSVLAYDRDSGSQLWNTTVSTGEFNPAIHPKNTHASPTVAIVGQHVIAVFNNHGKVQATALDFDGRQVWQKDVGSFKTKHPFGLGASPISLGELVLVTNENMDNARIVALDGKSGDEVWSIDRGTISSYSTPVIADIGGKQQLMISGDQKVASYDPAGGSPLWTCPASWEVTCGTMVWDEQTNFVFASGGYPTQETLAVDATTGKKVWGNSVKCYEQSLIVVDGFVYGYAEKGVIYCWQASDGKEMWKERFEGPESASPVNIGQHIFFTSENGSTLVINANPRSFQKVAVNKLGDESFASLAVCGGKIYTRVAFDEAAGRQEYLYCLGD